MGLASSKNWYFYLLFLLFIVVLSCGGSFIHAERKKLTEQSLSVVLSLEKETELLVQALNINTQSKLTFADASRFNSLVLDVFPKLLISQVEYKTLEDNIKSVLESKKLSFIPSQIEKILQLHEVFIYFGSVYYSRVCNSAWVVSL